MRKAYSALVFSYGCQIDKLLNIPGENLKGVYSAREFVEWYNGLPSASTLNPNLDCEDVVILGQGNVAIDVARMFLSPLDELRKTDISEYALDKISKSRVKRVHLVGRRGPLQAACTIAELRELTKLPNCFGIITHQEVEFLREKIKELPRPKKRMMELMLKIADSSIDNKIDFQKQWSLSFFKSPLEFLPSEENPDQLGKIRFSLNKLKDNIAYPTGETVELSTNLAFRSIGYRGVGIPGLPFDSERGLIPNKNGSVINERGLYCSGWIKRGPTGVIATTMNDGFETAKTILEDINSSRIDITSDQLGFDGLANSLKDIKVKPLNYQDWSKIDMIETQVGTAKGKSREKFVDIQEVFKLLDH
ncbi:DgyrCDS4838 [Dimorphilus gyrociliatus]|nr:DgyrCDS4838 [Dimorphilus gyrociliatus]